MQSHQELFNTFWDHLSNKYEPCAIEFIKDNLFDSFNAIIPRVWNYKEKGTESPKKNSMRVFLNNLTIPKLRQLCSYFGIELLQKERKGELIEKINIPQKIILEHIELIKNQSYMIDCECCGLYFVTDSIFKNKKYNLCDGDKWKDCMYCEKCGHIGQLSEYANTFYEETASSSDDEELQKSLPNESEEPLRLQKKSLHNDEDSESD